MREHPRLLFRPQQRSAALWLSLASLLFFAARSEADPTPKALPFSLPVPAETIDSVAPGQPLPYLPLLPGMQVGSLHSDDEAIEMVPPQGPVYDLTVEATHTYFANGVLAHNKFI